MMYQKLFLNGSYVDKDKASVNINDRGYIFGDGVYDVIAVVKGVTIHMDPHIDRLILSLDGISIKYSSNFKNEIKNIVDKLIKTNNVQDGRVYIQVTRGEAERDHCYVKGMEYNLLVFIQEMSLPGLNSDLIECTLHEDIRWKRRDIKAISLLANVMLRQIAKDKGCDEAILYQAEDNVVTECASRNLFIVDEYDNIFTHPADRNILSGITRSVVIDLAKKSNLKVLEKKFTVKEMLSAKEVFTTTTGHFINGVRKIDSYTIGNGKKGSITTLLERLYWKEVMKYVAKGNKNSVLS